jgi:hypothetical protein
MKKMPNQMHRTATPRCGFVVRLRIREMTVTVRGDFERFVRAMSRPAERPELPKSAGFPNFEVAALSRNDSVWNPLIRANARQSRRDRDLGSALCPEP